MGKFSTGFMAGSVIGAIGLGYIMRDKRVRKRLAKDTKKLAKRCVDAYEDVTDMF